jgi:hypothetical protein
VQLKFDISEIFSRHYICEDRQFSCGKDGAEGGATEESVRGTLFDKHVIALSEDVARLYCETSVAEIDLPADDIIFGEKTGNRAWPNGSGAPKFVCGNWCRN